MRQCPLKHKECPLKRQLVGRVVRSLEIQVAKATNREKNGSVEESIVRENTPSRKIPRSFKISFELKLAVSSRFQVYSRKKSTLWILLVLMSVMEIL